MAARSRAFRTHIARYLGHDLTIIVLANLAGAEPDRFVNGIAAIFDPKLAPPAPGPIADREPTVTARLRASSPPRGRVGSPRRSSPDPARPYAELRGGLGEPRRVELMARRDLGDDRVYRYVVA